MADPIPVAAFCTLEDVQAKEPNILDLADEGHLDPQLLSATQDIIDRLSLQFPKDIIDRIPTPDHTDATTKANTIPRQLRLPCVYRTLEIVFRANAKDEDSPYMAMAEKYESLFEKWMGNIKALDIDVDKDGVIEEAERDRLVTRPRIRRT